MLCAIVHIRKTAFPESSNTLTYNNFTNQAAYMMPGSLTAEAAVIHILVELGQLAFTGNGKYACIGQSPGKPAKFAGINHGFFNKICFCRPALSGSRIPQSVFIDFPSGISGIENSEPIRCIYKEIPGITLPQLAKFADERIARKPYTYIILGNEADLDMKTISSYGKVKRVSLEEAFGY